MTSLKTPSKLTPNQFAVLSAIDTSEYGCDLGDAVWTFTIADNCGLSSRSIPGTIGSLIRKGFVKSCGGPEANIHMTEAGELAYIAANGGVSKKRREAKAAAIAPAPADEPDLGETVAAKEIAAMAAKLSTADFIAIFREPGEAAIKPHALFKVWSADQVAECIDDIPRELYSRLWSLVSDDDATPGENDVPGDFEYTNLASKWARLSGAEQAALNAIAVAYELAEGRDPSDLAEEAAEAAHYETPAADADGYQAGDISQDERKAEAEYTAGAERYLRNLADGAS